MAELSYHPKESSVARPLRWFMNIAIALFVLFGISIAAFVQVWRYQVAQWKKAHRPELVMSMTPDQVISTFGPPYFQSKASDGSIDVITYKDLRHGIFCFVWFKEGTVQKVSFGAD